METESWIPNHSIIKILEQDPYNIKFFQAVRMLEKFDVTNRRKRRDVNPALNFPVRFHTLLSLDFPPSEIYDLWDFDHEGGNRWIAHLRIAFMGLTGPQGVLPIHYTENLIKRRVYLKDHTAHDFFDIFNHRMISLFYLAWKKYNFWVSEEQQEDQSLQKSLVSFCGLGSKGLQEKLNVTENGLSDEQMVYYSGILSQKPKSFLGCERILSDLFSIPITIKSFCGEWLNLEQENLSLMGEQNCKLGKNTMLGYKTWNHQSNFKISIQPRNYEQFKQFLPNGNAFQIMMRFIKFYLGKHLNFKLDVKITGACAPECKLDASSNELLLGWNTWLGQKEPNSMKQASFSSQYN